MIVPDRPSSEITAPNRQDSTPSMADPFPSSTPQPYTASPLSEENTFEPHKDSFEALALAPPPPSPAFDFWFDRDYDSEEDFIRYRSMHDNPHLPTPRSTVFFNTALFALAVILIQLTVVLPYLISRYFISFHTEQGLRATRESCFLASCLSCLVLCIGVLCRWKSGRSDSQEPKNPNINIDSITTVELDQRLLESYARRINPPLTLRAAMLKSFLLVALTWLVVTGMVTGTCAILAISEAGWRLVGIL